MTPDRQATWNWSGEQIRRHQLDRLNLLIDQIRIRPFYQSRLGDIDLPLKSIDDIQRLPLLTKDELVGSSPGQPARVFDLPRTDYARVHQTSGTSGFPMPVYDTASDWQWWLECWDHVLEAAEVTTEDIAMMAFSFGPFIGFWTANDALIRRGVTVVPGGGMTSQQRLQMIHDHCCTVICCTPTYALHLANVAEDSGVSLTDNQVRKVIVAGEPGGSIQSVRERIEQAWGAVVTDHAGASELGAWGFGSRDGRGLHVIETEFIAELLRFDDQHPSGVSVSDGEEAELVLTNLGRTGGPAIRYRTGDVVRGYRDHDQSCKFLWLEGGVIGRTDDMIVVRGVNIFPSSIEAIIRDIFPSAEFRIIVSQRDEMDQLEIELETDPAGAQGLADVLRDRLAMRVPVRSVESNSLPRFEAKARRLEDRR